MRTFYCFTVAFPDKDGFVVQRLFRPTVRFVHVKIFQSDSFQTRLVCVHTREFNVNLYADCWVLR